MSAVAGKTRPSVVVGRRRLADRFRVDSGLPRGGERTADADLERLFAARLSAGGFKL